MLRINHEVTPLRLPLDPSQHMIYSDKGVYTLIFDHHHVMCNLYSIAADSTWACRPVTVMRSMLGQVLHSRLDLTKHTPSNNLYSDLAGGDSLSASRITPLWYIEGRDRLCVRVCVGFLWSTCAR